MTYKFAINLKKKLKNEHWKSSETPSLVTNDYWIYAFAKKSENSIKNLNYIDGGKWLIFVDINEVDRVWQIIKKATENGLLGESSKAATALLSPHAIADDKKVICVYTYNWHDIEDVFRVEKSIRSLGIESDLFYKADKETLRGNYKVHGDKNLSKYVSKVNKTNSQISLESLYGINESKLELLQKYGIKTIEDLLGFNIKMMPPSVGISKDYLLKIQMSALSMIDNTIFQKKAIEFPEGEVIHFDIETDLTPSYDLKKIWSIALHHNQKVKVFYASTWNEEKKILTDFLNYINGVSTPIMCSYSGSGFDKNILSSAINRHGLNAECFLKYHHIDLCTIIRQNYVFPLKSYGLKEIGKYLGFLFSNENLNGLFVAQHYINCQRNGKKVSKEIKLYIEDDVKVMDFILTQLKTRTDIKKMYC